MNATKELIIKQGKPDSKCFILFYPMGKPVQVGQIIYCVHPKTNVSTKSVCIGFSTENWFNVSEVLCELAYGNSAINIKTALEEKFPEFRNQNLFKVLYLKEIPVSAS